MKRRSLLILACAVAAMPSRAAETRTLKPGQVLRGRFEQERRLQGFTAPLLSEGRFVLAFGRGLIWRVEKPFQITTIITAGGLIQDTSGTETMRLTAARMPFMSRLYNMLSGALAGDTRGLAADFNIQDTTDADGWRTDLSPKQADDPGMPFRTIVVRGRTLVEHVEMLKPGGDSDTLHFLDQTVSTGPLTGDEAAALAR